MCVETERDFVALARIGRIVGLTLQEMERAVRPGMTTLELDEIGERFMKSHGAQSAPRLFKNFPSCNCLSLNEEAVHAPAGPRQMRPGDIVKIDVTAEQDGYVADACVSVILPPSTEKKRRLVKTAETAFRRGAHAARAGRPIYEIGRAVDAEVRRNGFTVLKELHSHGVGRTIHEDPSIPMWHDKRAKGLLQEGLIITIEPIISAGSAWVVSDPDGWTIRTADGSLSAHYEHTVMITKDRPVLLTELA